MNHHRLRRLIFVTGTCLVSLPWLVPCGITAIPAAMIRATDRSLQFAKRDPANPTASQFASMQDKPGMPFVVRQNQTIPRSELISEAEWSQMASHKQQYVEDNGLDKTEQLARFLDRIDPGSHMHEYGTKPRQRDADPEPRKELVLCTGPLVLLQADSLRFVRPGKRKLPVMAEAQTKTMMANATISSPAGNIFVVAHRICFRASTSELILQGSPVVQSGRHEVKPARSGALMKVNFITRTVTVEGHALETRF